MSVMIPGWEVIPNKPVNKHHLTIDPLHPKIAHLYKAPWQTKRGQYIPTMQQEGNQRDNWHEYSMSVYLSVSPIYQLHLASCPCQSPQVPILNLKNGSAKETPERKTSESLMLFAYSWGLPVRVVLLPTYREEKGTLLYSKHLPHILTSFPCHTLVLDWFNKNNWNLF